MEITNRTTTTTTRGRRTCADILATLSDVDRRALERWRRISDDDSVYLGGRGRTLEQMSIAARAWDALSPATREAYYSMVRVTTQNLVDAIRDAGIPKAKNEIEAIQVLLGPDHPALKILPALGLVVAYWDALDQIEG